MQKTELNCSCGSAFKPNYSINGLLLSKMCPDCRYKHELSKRITAKQKPVKSPENGVKTNLTKNIAKLMILPIPKLVAMAQEEFNLYIRNRDRLPNDTFYCPTCNKTKRINGNNYHACHLFPAGHYPALRFDERNVYGGCQSCNYYKHGVGYEYSEWVRKKLGESEWESLNMLKDYWKSHQFKYDRFSLIETITKYKLLNKSYGI